MIEALLALSVLLLGVGLIIVAWALRAINEILRLLLARLDNLEQS